MRPAGKQAQGAGELLLVDLQVRGLQPVLPEQAQHLAQRPVGSLPGRDAAADQPFEQPAQPRRAQQDRRVPLRQPVFRQVPRALLLRELRHAAAHLRKEGLVQHHGRQVRLREVAVVLRVFLGAHGEGGALVVVPAAGLLADGAALAQQLDLPLGLGAHGAGHGLDGVEVLHLRAHAERLAAHGAARRR